MLSVHTHRPLLNSMRASVIFLTVLALTSCRFGNYTTKDQANTGQTMANYIATATDGFTGFYRTAATQLKYCAKIHSGPNLFCVAGDLSIGSTWSQYIQDPQAIAQDPSDVTKVLFFTDVLNAKGFRIKRDNATDYSGTLAASQAFVAGNCSGVESFSISGTTNRQTGLPAYAGYAISGRTSIAAQWLIQLDEVSPGDCTATAAAIESCYLDVNNCTGATLADRQALHTQLVALLHDAVSTGALQATQIHDLEYTGYVLQYQ